MLKFVFFLFASLVTSNLALADNHEAAIADPAEISFVFNTLLFLIGISFFYNDIFKVKKNNRG